MTCRRPFFVLAAAAALATPSLADEPGPGGTRPPVARTGEEIYRTYCQTCHMADGQGAAGAAAFPALAHNPRLGTAAYAVYIVENGRGGMPWFRDALSPDQVAAVTTWLRTHFGNDYPEPVTTEEVAAGRR